MSPCSNNYRGLIRCLWVFPCCLITTWNIPALASASSPSNSSSNSNSNSSSNNKDRCGWDISHPLDEGLWSSDHQEDIERECLEEEERHVHIDKKFRGLRNDLRWAEIDSLRLFSKTPAIQPMEYSIFKQGRSALRDIAKSDKHLVMPERLFGFDRRFNGHHHHHHRQPSPHYYRACAALLLLRGYSDAAHEVLLGVTLDNLKEAEYAATHRGKTDWAKQHPLSDSADMLHAAIHRIVEGNRLGEGNHSGYDNARYWLAGGPKLLGAPAPHPVRTALAQIAQEHTPLCVAAGVVVAQEKNGAAEHTVMSGGGKARVVRVPCGQWDDLTFLELCQQWVEGSLDKDLEDEVATLQRAEIILLLRYELKHCLGRQTTTSSTTSS